MRSATSRSFTVSSGNFRSIANAWWGWEDSNFQPNYLVGLGGLELPNAPAACGDFLASEVPEGGAVVCTSTLSLQIADGISIKRLRRLPSLLQKIPFPRMPLPNETLFGCMRLLPRKTEHLVLPGPFGRRIGEASNAHAMRQPAIDGRFDQIGREESQRDGHVDFSRAAVFSRRDAVRTRCWISDEFIKPTTAVGNRRDQSRARFCTHGASVLRPDPLGEEDLTAPSCRCLLPRHLKGACWLGKLDDQPTQLDLDARNVSMDETAVINGLRGFEMVPNRFDDQRLDGSCRYAAH